MRIYITSEAMQLVIFRGKGCRLRQVLVFVSCEYPASASLIPILKLAIF